MTVEDKDDVSTLLRSIGYVPAPTSGYRQRAWRAFEYALERHLARKRGVLRPLESRR